MSSGGAEEELWCDVRSRPREARCGSSVTLRFVIDKISNSV